MTAGQNVLLAAALGYAARGWRVVPQAPAGKRALVKGWPEAATDDRGTIRGWWRVWPDANIGICTGRSGLVVLDIDGAQGWESFAAYPWAPERGCSLPPTITSVTARGVHLVYRVAEGRVGKNTAALDGWPGLEVKGGKSLFTVPPSIHPSGHVYRWVNDHASLEPVVAPECLLAPVVTATARPVASRGFPAWEVGTPYGRRALYDLMTEMLEAQPGARHTTLVRVGYRVAELAARGHLDDGDARDRLRLVAREVWSDSPADVREIETTISDAWRRVREVAA